MKLRVLMTLALLAVSTLWAEESIGGQGINPLTRIELLPEIHFVITKKKDSDSLGWEFVHQHGGSKMTQTSGIEIKPGEKYAYLWIPETKTMWVATSTYIEATTIQEKLRNTSSTVYSTERCGRSEAIPESFQKKIAAVFGQQKAAP